MGPSRPLWSRWPAGGIEESTTTSSSSSPISHGYTGQQADATTGLDYYRARYYDPLAGQFTSANSVADGLNRYGYVAGNPETATDPSGHRVCGGGNCEMGGGGSPDGDPDFTDNHWHYIMLHPRGTADCGAGCACASSHGAEVGPGKKVQSADATHPDIYAWGDADNGALALGFSGENLQALIGAFQELLHSMQVGDARRN